MNHRRDAKKLIISALRAHPEGLMLTELAGITRMNRFTVTKYIHELKGSGRVFQKSAAAAKLCYLKDSFDRKTNHRENIKGSSSIRTTSLFIPILIISITILTFIFGNQVAYAFDYNQSCTGGSCGTATCIGAVCFTPLYDCTVGSCSGSPPSCPAARPNSTWVSGTCSCTKPSVEDTCFACPCNSNSGPCSASGSCAYNCVAGFEYNGTDCVDKPPTWVEGSDATSSTLAGVTVQFNLTMTDNNTLHPNGKIFFGLDNCTGTFQNYTVNYTTETNDVYLFVNANTSDFTGWYTSGSEPFLNNSTSNYIETSVLGIVAQGNFSFANYTGSDAVASVNLSFEGFDAGGGNSHDVYLYNGSWYNIGPVVAAAGSWTWSTKDITQYISTPAAINNTQIWINHTKTAVSNVAIRKAMLVVRPLQTTFIETPQTISVVKTINDTIGCELCWYYNFSDNAGNWNDTLVSNPFCFNTTENIPPTYSNNQTDTTSAGQPCNFTLNWTDNYALSPGGGYIFSTNNSGTWVNSSWTAFSSTPETAWNVTVLNSTEGTLIQWKFYANDNFDNWNASDVFSFVTLPSYCDVGIDYLPYSISQSNTYYCLVQDLSVYDDHGVTFVTVQNSTLDCLNRKISFTGSASRHGVGDGGSDLNNTIKNCNIIDFYYGLDLQSSNYTITDNNVTNPTFGMYLTGDFNILENSIVSDATDGIYLSDSNNNTIKNTIAKGSNTRAFCIKDSFNNTFNNITALNTKLGIEILGTTTTPSNNIVENSSIAFSSITTTNADYKLTKTGSMNYFRNTNFTTPNRTIYFSDASSWFNYNNQTTGNIWLKTNVSSATRMGRRLVNWNQTLMKWNDSVSSSVTARYNISGLKSCTLYNISNDSVLVNTLSTNEAGMLPSFYIYLSSGSGHEIKVEETDDTFPPTYSNNQTNTTLAGQPCNFTLDWTDKTCLSGYIFSTNNSGTWVNSSWTAFSSKPETAWNVTFLNSTEGTLVQWKFYANDTSNNWNVSEIYSLTTKDETPPQWSDNTTNNTVAGKATEFRLRWTDNVELSYYIFSFDNCTGSLQNITNGALSGTEDWSNVTHIINDTIGCIIRWRVYANDTSNNWNASEIFTLTTNHSYCNVFIDNTTIPYTIDQSNTYYCLNEDIGKDGFTAINFTSGVQNTTLDCLGYNIDSNDTSDTYGVYLTGSETKNNIIKNCVITDFYSGIYLSNGPNNNIITNTTTNSNNRGIEIQSSDNNQITNVTANTNINYGIYAFNSENNVISNSTLLNNGEYDFAISAYPENYCNNILTNVIGTDNKAIVYSNYSITIEHWYNNVSQIILCNADNSLINNVTMIRSGVRNNDIILIRTDYTNVTNVYVKNHGYGIGLRSSHNNIIANSTFNDTAENGIYVYNSNNNTITNNTANNNDNNGIYLQNSDNNIINNNKFNNNTYYGIQLWSYNYNNILIDNIASNNGRGISIDYGWGNNITGGSISNNNQYDYEFRNAGTNNTFINTNFTAARKIQFHDNSSWFNYNNETTGNIWLKTNVSTGIKIITRELTSWSQSLMQWNDSASDVTARYNITGLNANKYYNVYNSSVLTYTLKTDPSGNLQSFKIYLSGEREIKVEEDTEAPTINIQKPENISYNYNVSLPLNYTVSDNFAVDECWYSLDSGSNQTLTNCQNTTFDVSYDGSHYITIFVNDTSGNDNSSTVYFTVDTTPPVITIQNPNPDEILGWIIYLLTDISDTTSSVDKAWYTISNSTWSTSGILSPPDYDSTWDSSTYGDGNYTFTVYANDTVGNQNSTYVNFTVDNTKPSVDIIYPDGVIVNSNFNLDLRAQNEHLDSSWYNITNATWSTSNASYNLYPQYAKSYNFTDLINIINYADGNYTINFTAFDVVGNNRTTTSWFYVDKTLPSFSNYVEPSDPSTYSPSATYTFNVTIDDNEAVNPSTVKFNFDGVNFTTGITQNVNNYSITIGSYKAGTFNYKWYAQDTVGNEAESATNTFTILRVNSTVLINITPESPIDYGTQSNASCVDTNLEASNNLYRNNTLANSENNVYITLPAGSWNYTCNVSQTENYTAASNSTIYIVNKATPYTSLEINGTTFEKGSTVNITSWSTPSILATMIYTNYTGILENITSLVIGTNTNITDTSNLALGTYQVSANTTGNTNYTDNSTLETKYFTVVDTTPPQYFNNQTQLVTVYSPVGYSNFSIEWFDNDVLNGTYLENNFTGSLLNVSMNGSNPYYYNSSVMKAGTYQFRFVANDTSGNENATDQITFTISKATSEINLLLNGTDGNRNYDQNEGINITVILVTPSLLETVYIDTNITGWTIDSGSSPYTNITIIQDVDTYNITGYWLGNENYTSNYETHYIITDDITPPQWSDNKTLLTSGTSYQSNQFYQFNITWTDNVAVDTVYIEHNFTVSSPLNDSFTGNENSEYYFDVSDLKAGTYVWRSYANDTSNNWNKTDQWIFVVSQASPQVYLELNGTPNDKSYYENQTANITAWSNILILNTTIYANYSGVLEKIKSGPSIQENITDLSNLLPGNYLIKANVTGNENYTDNSTGLSYIITVLNIPPSTSSLISPDDEWNTTDTTPSFNWTDSTDPSNVEMITYELEIDDQPDFTSLIIQKTGLSESNYTLTPGEALSDDQYYWRVRAYDGYDYSEYSNNRTFTVDITPPIITIQNPDPDEILGWIIYLETTITDTLVGVDYAWYTISNSTWSTSGILSPPDYDNTWNSTNATDDYYTFTVYANDTLGNQNSTYVNFTVDNSKPSVDIVYPDKEYLNSDFNLDLRANNWHLNLSWYNITNATWGTSNASYNIYPATSFNFTDLINIINYADGNYTINFTAVDAAGNNRTTTSWFYVDKTPPQWSNNKSSLTNPTYTPDQTYQFNITWTDNVAVDKVIFEWNGTNITVTSYTASEYYITLTDLSAGIYTYKWYANDTVNNQNSTDLYTYIINKVSCDIDLWLNDGPTDQNNSIDYGIMTNATATLNISGNVFYLERNSTQVDSGVDVVNESVYLAAGVYNYTSYWPESENYSACSEESYLTVNKIRSVISVLIQPSLNETYPTETNVTCYINTGDETATLNLSRNETLVASGQGQQEEIVILGAHVYNYTCIYVESENYTSNSTSDNFLTISKGTSNASLELSPGSPIIYETQTIANCTADSPEASSNLYRNQTLVNQENNTAITLPAGTWYYVCNVTETENYTSASNTSTYVVNKALTETNLLLNGEDNDKVYYIPTDANLTVTVNVSGETVYLDTNISGWVIQYDVTPLYNYTTLTVANIYNITGYYLGNENYSSSYETHYAIVSTNQVPQWSNITNSPTSPTTYSPSKNYQFNVTCVDVDTGMYNAWMTFDGIRYYMSNESSEYYVTLTDLSAGNHYYNFTCNDTLSGTNTTSDLIYVIDKDTTTIYLALNDTQNDRTYTYPEDINATGWKTIEQDSSLTLYRDGTSVGITSGNKIYEYFDPGAHTYNYTLVLTATNYTASSVERIATVNKGSTETRVYLNGTRGNKAYIVNSTANLTITLDVPGKTVRLDTNFTGWTVQSATTPLYNFTELIYDPGVYYITGYFTGDENYTSSSETHYLTIFTGMTITVVLNETEVWWGEGVNASGIVERSGTPASNVNVTIDIDGNIICSDMPNTTSQGSYSCVFNAPYSVGIKTVRVQITDEINDEIITNTAILEVKVWWGETEEEMERAKNIACYEVPKLIQNPDGTINKVMVKICVWK